MCGALQAEIEATSILVTHDPADAFALADDIIVLDHGRVLQAGPVNAVFARPHNALVAHLLGAEIASDGRAAAPDRMDIGGHVMLEVAGPALRTGAALGWSIAPDLIRIVAEGGIPATIVRLDAPLAGRQRMTIRLGEAERPVVLPVDQALRPGPVRVVVPPAAIQIWEREPAAAL